jgi:hypothetical protein
MKHSRLTLAAIAALAAAGTSHGQQLPVADSAQGPRLGRPLPRATPISARRPDLIAGAAVAATPALNAAQLLQEDSLVDAGPARMGVVQPVNLSSSQAGAWTRLDDGRWIWVAIIRAQGALSARLHANPWKPPAGATLTVYNGRDVAETFGPLDGAYGSDEGFWTPTVYASDVYVEYVLPAQLDPRAAASELVITELLSGYRSPMGTVIPTREVACEQDVTCQGAWANTATGVGAIGTVSNPFGYFCSGALMTRNPTDFCPLFMTATHCGITAASANTTEITWLYQTAICNQPGTVPSLSSLPRTVGSVLLAQDVTTDWTLVGLQSAVPGGLYYLGWDPNALAVSSPVAGIHHPSGSYKRISFGTKDGNNAARPNPVGGTSCIAGTGNHVAWSSGLTEPGSSGSPLFDGSQRIRGTLSCGNAATCTGANSSDYGRLDSAFGFVSPFLTPTDPIYVSGTFGGFENGAFNNPFRTVGKGAFAVRSGSNVYVVGGSYPEHVTIDRPMTINAYNGTVTIGQ